MGNYTNLNNSTQTLSIHNSVQSNDIMCIGVAEYRNGVLLSEYTRIWVVGTRPGTYSTDPYAAPGSNFYHTTCPGQLGIIPVSFQDSTTTDSVFLDFFPPNLNGFNFYSLSNALPGSASGMIYWTTPVNVTEAEVPYFIIRVRARNNSCPEQPYSYYGYLVDRINCVVLSPEDIYAANEGAYNRIDWNLAAGSASQYVIERGSDGINFAAIGTQAAGKESYTYWDRKPLSGTNFYRLKLENADGIVSYSKVVTAIVNTGNARITAFPNPTNDLLNISVEGSVSGEPSIYLSDLSGRTVWSATGVNTGNVEVDMKNFASGIYVIRYKDGMHNQVLKVVKQ